MTQKDRFIFISVGTGAVLLSIGIYLFVSQKAPELPPVEIVHHSSSNGSWGPSIPSAVNDQVRPAEEPVKPKPERSNEPVTNWQERYGDPSRYSSVPPPPAYEKDILAVVERPDMTDLNKATTILDKMSALPDDGKIFAMDQAAKLIPDQNYLQLRGHLNKLASNDELRESVLTDVLTRGDSVRMPALVEMLRQPANAGQAEIREILSAYLDDQLGNQSIASLDPTRIDQLVAQFLAANPE